MTNNKKGFTLIELLVVIAIIGLLSTLAVASLTRANAKARDTKRLADVGTVRTALEMYYSDQNSYPVAITTGVNLEEDGVFYVKVPTAPAPDGDCTVTDNTYVYEPVEVLPAGSGVYSSYKLTYCLGGDAGSVLKGVNTASPRGMTE